MSLGIMSKVCSIAIILVIILSSLNAVLGKEIQVLDKNDDSITSNIERITRENNYLPERQKILLSEDWNLTGKVIVKFHDLNSESLRVINESDGELLYLLERLDMAIVYVCNSSLTQQEKIFYVENFMTDIANSPDIEFLEADRTIIPDYDMIPNDPLFSSDQWALPAINLPDAWDITTGDGEVIVAIVDSGINYNHEDIANNMWRNTGEGWNDDGTPNKDGVDDDDNGFVDDHFGFDFANSFTYYDGDDIIFEEEESEGGDGAMDEAYDDVYHGTFCAGVIGAVKNNNLGIAGAADVKLMAIKTGSSPSQQDTPVNPPPFDNVDIIAGITYAIDNGAKIISMSFGFRDMPGVYGSFKGVLDDAWNSGCLLITSSGNSDDGDIGSYDDNGKSNLPAFWETVMAVGATNNINQRCSPLDWGDGFGSNYGVGLEVVAPGDHIISTNEAPDEYETHSGTSFAGPYVAGVAALVWSLDPTLTNKEVRAILNVTATDLIYTSEEDSAIDGWDEYTGHGLVNAHEALIFTQEFGPGEVILNPPNIRTSDSITIEWTDYDNTNNDFVQYIVHGYSKVTDSWVELPESELGIQISDIGTTSYSFTGLSPNTEHKFWVELSSSQWGLTPSNEVYLRTLDDTAPISEVSYNGGWQSSFTIQITQNNYDTETGVVDGDLEYRYATITDGVIGTYNEWQEVGDDKGDLSLTSFIAPDAGAYQFRNRARNGDGLWSEYFYSVDTCKIETLAPSITSFLIDDDASSTTTRTVSLAISASDADSGVGSMRFTNEADYGSKWKSVQTSMDSSHPILPGDSEYVIITKTGASSMKVHFNVIDTRENLDYVYVKDSGDNVINTYTGLHTNVWSSEITGSYAKIEIVCNIFDTFGSWGFSINEYQYLAEEWGEWQSYGTSASWTLSEGYGTKTVYCQVMDNAGLISEVVSDQISFQPFGTQIIINGDAQYTNSLSVDLTLSSDISPVSMRFTNIEDPVPTWHYGGDPNINNAREIWWRSDLVIPSVDSAHPYIGGGSTTDYFVNAPSSSATEMRVVLPDIQLWEHPTSPSTYDKITLHDGTYLPSNPHYDDIFDSFRGTQSWVESEIVPSNSVRIRLETEDVSPGDWGFTATQVNWRDDNLYYSNGFDQTWSISKPEALKMKVTFSSIDLGAGDVLTVWDSSGTLATFVGESRGLTTVAGNSGSTIWIRLENINENTRGWGFDISRWDYYYDSSWTDWEPWATSKSWTLESGSDGDRQVTVQVKDSGGSIAQDYDSIILDTSVPNIPFTAIWESSPYIYKNGNTLYYSDLMGSSPQSFTITGTATNGGSGLWKATASSAFGDSPPDDLSADSWSFVYDIIDSDAGSGTITIWVYDNAGNFNSVSFNYYEDKDGPSIWNTFPPNGYVLADQTPSLSWGFSDLTGGIISGFTIQISSDSSFSTIIGEYHTYSSSIEWPDNLNEGTYYWRVLAQDYVGNAGEMPAKSFSIDLTSPTTGISSPNNGDTLTGVVDIIGTASDLNFQSYSLKVGFGASPVLFTEIASLTSAVTNGLLGTWDTTDKVKNGDWTIRLTAEDIVGHVNQYSIVVDVDNPTSIDDLEVSSIRLDDMTCSFFLNENQIVSAWVEDSSSSVVKNILNNKFMLAGQYPSGVRWDWTNSIGDPVPNGDYTIFVDSTSAPAASVDVFIRNAPTITVSSGLGSVNPTFSWSNPIGSGATWFISSDDFGYYETTTSTSITLHIQEPSITIDVYGVNQNYITRVGSITYSPQLAMITGTISAPSAFWSLGNHVTISVTADSLPDYVGWQPTGVASVSANTPSYQLYVPSGYYRIMGYISNSDYTFDDSVSYFQFLSVSAGNVYEKNFVVVERPPNTGGGGCPYLYVWNGTDYQVDNNILPGSEYQSDLAPDTIDYFKLNLPIEPVNGIIPLGVAEDESEYSIFDSFELLCIDHDGSSNVAMDTDGNVRTFSNTMPPVSCVDKKGNDQLSNISTMDEPYFMGYKGDWLELDFGPVTSETSKLVVQSDLKPGTGGPISPAGDNEVPAPINVQILDEWGQWHIIDEIYPRNFWSFDIVDLSDHVGIGQELVIRLEWEAYHHLAFVGLDSSADSDINIINAELVQADHIYLGNVTNVVKYADGRYVDVDKYEYLILNFSYVEQTDIVRDYVLVSKGYYCYREDRPVASFTSIPSVSETFDPVYFDARESYSIEGNITGYYYYFGDGTESGWLSQPITYHEYTDDGTYNVTLIVKDEHVPARIGVSYITVTIFNQPPEAAFDIYQEVEISLRVAGRKGNTVTCQIYEDGILIDELPVTRTIGDPNVGTISFNKYIDREYEIIITYEAAHQGTNPTWLSVSSGDYCQTEFLELNEKDGDYQEYDVTSLVDTVSESNMHYFFDASRSFDIDGEIISYSWSVGEGHYAFGETVENTYRSEGIYFVTLTVTDDDGLIATTSKKITVGSPFEL